MPRFHTPLRPALASYTMNVRIGGEPLTLWGDGEITWTHENDAPLQVLKVSGAYDALEVNAPCGCAVDRQGDEAFLTFDRPLECGDMVRMSVRFQRPMMVSPLMAGDGSVWMPQGGMDLWYPHLAWDIPLGGHYALRITAPDGWMVCATGRVRDGAYIERYVRCFGLLLCKGLALAETMVGDVLVRGFFPERHRLAAERLLRTAASAIEHYVELLGMYPQRALSFLPFSDRWHGGMNWATGIAAFHSLDDYNAPDGEERPWIAAHEVGHHYWGEYVLDGDVCPWLWIGLGLSMDETYASRYGLEQSHQEYALRVLDAYARGEDVTLWRSMEWRARSEEQGDYNGLVLHGRSCGIMHLWKAAVGEAAWLATLRRLLMDYAGRPLRTGEFIVVCEEVSGQRLDWLFGPALHSNRLPGYTVSEARRTDDGVEVELTSFGGWKVPVDVQACFTDGTTQTTRADRCPDQQTLHFRGAGDVEVRVNPAGLIPVMRNPVEMPLHERILRSGYVDDGDALARYACAANQTLEDDLLFRLGSQLFTGAHDEEALSIFQQLAARDTSPWNLLMPVFIAIACDVLGRREEALCYYRRLMDIVPEQGVFLQASQISLTVDRAWLLKRLEEPYRRELR